MARWRSTGSVRVSFSAILRIKADDRYVLFDTPARPGTFSPPGGVFKYFPPAMRLLEQMGFREDRIPAFAETMRLDLRGFIPAAATRQFCRWFAGGAYREDSAECLRRELGEELAEVGLDHLLPSARRPVFSAVRTVVEGPSQVLGKPYRQLRRFEVHDLVVCDAAAERLRGGLIQAGLDETVPRVVCASAADILYGRSGAGLIAGHTAYLFAAKRSTPDIPPLL
jgi:SMODS-associated NUDIX domain